MVLRDVSYAIRVLSRHSGFTTLVVLAMALGIAASTLLFSVMNAAMLQPLPYRDANRLALVWDQLLNLRLLEFPTSRGVFVDYRARNRSFEQLEAFSPFTVSLQFTDRAERVGALRVTAGFLQLLGTHAVVGRTFEAGEDAPGKDNAVLLGHGLWMRRFGGNRDAVGQQLRVDNRSYTIAGILEPSFRFRLAGGVPPDVVIPIPMDPDPTRTRDSLYVLGRLRAGVTLEQAQSDMKALAKQLKDEFRIHRGPKGEDAGYTVNVVGLRQQLYGGATKSLMLLFAATIALLAITCANVAHLFLEWRSKRREEFAIREWMGATRGALWRQTIIESLIVSLAGGVVAIIAVWFGALALAARLPRELSALDGLPLDARVFLFALLICTVTGIALGMMPNKTKSFGRRVTSEGSKPWLVVAQTSLSVVLLVTAVILIRSMLRLESVAPGFRTENVLTGQLVLPVARFRTREEGKVYWDRMLEWFSRQPEFPLVALSSTSPMYAGPGADPFSIEGRPFELDGPTPQIARYQVVSPGYFPLLQIPLVSGRLIEESDQSQDRLVAVINQTMAQRFWPNENPIGKRITKGAARAESRWMTIVGVVADVKNAGLDSRPLPQIYHPIAQEAARFTTLMVGTLLPPDQMAAKLEERMAMFDREMPLYGIASMEKRILRTLEQPRFRTSLFAAFGLLAFALAAFGVYSVTAFRVAQRTREIGIRMAIGAEPSNIRWWIAGHTLRPVAIGLLLGIVVSLAAGSVLTAFLYETSPRDGTSYLITVAVFVSVAWIASVLPAHRAARLQPSVTLRHE